MSVDFLCEDTKLPPPQFDASFPGAAFEDVAYCQEAAKRGNTMSIAHSAVVGHDYRTTLGALFA